MPGHAARRGAAGAGARPARGVPPDREGGAVCRLRDRGPRRPGAGLDLAQVCLADLGRRGAACPATSTGAPCPSVQVVTDHPVQACLASQYAGWAIQRGKSTSRWAQARCAAAWGERGDLRSIGCREERRDGVGVLEAQEEADPGRDLASRRGVPGPPSAVTLLVAPTASIAGTLQVVARSVETSLHKLHELEFDVGRVRLGAGHCPASARRHQRPRGDRPDQRRDPLRGARRPVRDGRRRQPRADRAEGPLVELSHDHGEPFARSSPATTTTSTRSTPTCSAPLRWPSTTSRRDVPSTSAHCAPRSSCGRSSAGERGEVPRANFVSSPQFVTLVSGLGWHVQDLRRAADGLGVGLDVVRFRRLRASVGSTSPSLQAGLLRLDRGRRGARPDDAAGEPRAGRVPDGRPAPAGGGGRARAEPAPGRGGGRRQVPFT